MTTPTSFRKFVEDEPTPRSVKDGHASKVAHTEAHNPLFTGNVL